MIEQAMYFALGFLVAGLFTLMFLPAFWRRALRLSMRRLQMLAPLSMDEVIAERDLLRADFAVRERRLEQEMEAVKAARALDLAAVGRHAARVAELDQRLKAAEADNRDMEMRLRESQKLIAERTELLSSTEMALHEMTERAERGVENVRLLESHSEELGRQTQAHQSRVVAHEARIGALHEQNGQLQHALETLREDFARVSQAAARAPGLEADGMRLAAELEITRSARQAFATELEDTRGRLKTALERHRNEVDHFENALRMARAEAREHADRLEAARADNAMLQGAVEVLRAERANLRRAGAVSPARAPLAGAPAAADTGAEIAALRRTIIDFGERIVASEPAQDAPARDAQAR